MARVVHKFAVSFLGDLGPVQMPVGAEVLHADCQGNQVFVWALVDPDAEMETRRFGVFGTGHPVPEDARHIGTCIERNWGLVWHVFEEGR